LPEGKIKFSNLSIGASTYKWNFGDGTNSSTLENPSHYYFNEGTYTVTLEVASTNSCKDTLKKGSFIVVSNNPPTSVNENSIPGINVYPNPTTGFLYINTGAYGADNNIEVSITDITGRTLLKRKLIKQGLIEIDLSCVMPGNYMLTINVNGIMDHKIIIVK
jgi:PKD repeat protein